MISILKSNERGQTRLDWLLSRHSFSFGDYYDPQRMGFRSLRVINDDRVAPGGGFGMHGHRDMEIVTYVLEGALEHKDSLGNGSALRPGEVQRMTAGTGIRHSEFNPSATDPVHFLQIWIEPERRGLAPGYEQKAFPETERLGKLRLVAARGGGDGAVTIHQDADVWAGVLRQGDKVEHRIRPGRQIWLQVAKGSVSLNGECLREGDAAAFAEERSIDLTGDNGSCEVLLFDLA